jgi:hypothetical protein
MAEQSALRSASEHEIHHEVRLELQPARIGMDALPLYRDAVNFG